VRLRNEYADGLKCVEGGTAPTRIQEMHGTDPVLTDSSSFPQSLRAGECCKSGHGSFLHCPLCALCRVAPAAV
jgi:hypothetical protein